MPRLSGPRAEDEDEEAEEEQAALRASTRADSADIPGDEDTSFLEAGVRGAA